VHPVGPGAGCALALALAACTVGPNYRPPVVDAPATYAEAPADAAPPSDAALTSWWSAFNDPVLNDLIRRANADNLDLQAAASRVREARQSEVIARAAGLPSISATGTALTYNSNRKASPTLPIPSSINLYSAGFDASWEIDIFGGVRRGVEAARANTAAAEWARRDGQVSLTAEVANDYLTLRAVQVEIALNLAQLQRENELFSLIGDRRKTGFVTNLDVNQQRVQVAATAAQIPTLTAQSKVLIHALGVLLGEPPEALAQTLAPTTVPLPLAAPALPAGLPSDLLRRRPDIRAAERRLAASNAEIGVKEADLYPKLDLRGLGSFASTGLGNLFSAQNLASAGVGMLTAPVFNAGKTRATIRAAREENFQALTAYRSTVLGAFRDVEDALSRYEAERARNTSLAQSVTAARNTLLIARDQYATGLVTYVNVLQADDAVLNGENQLAGSDALVLSDLVSVYKALGGGWS
jgi:NodT family efflux transporter outer membrane factor (OMF) lipoprotein